MGSTFWWRFSVIDNKVVLFLASFHSKSYLMTEAMWWMVINEHSSRNHEGKCWNSEEQPESSGSFRVSMQTKSVLRLALWEAVAVFRLVNMSAVEVGSYHLCTSHSIRLSLSVQNSSHVVANDLQVILNVLWYRMTVSDGIIEHAQTSEFLHGPIKIMECR